MMFKTIIFGGFLLATVCATEKKPRIATLDVLPNLDMSLTHKDFRVHYSGAGDDFTSSSSATIKIYKDTDEFHKFTVKKEDINTPKAYYFGLDTATAGEYKVEVCVGSDCSDINPALTKIPAAQKKVTCDEGSYTEKEWIKSGVIELDVIGTDKWLEKSQISPIDQIIQTEWTKNNVKSNPGYDESTTRLYAGVTYDVGHYRQFFINNGTKVSEKKYSHEFCERKYLLSYHVHILQKDTKEVIHRFKETLYLSDAGKKRFLIDNTNTEKAERPQVHVELVSTDDALKQLDKDTQYQVWVSFCATEKDENESTVCSDPLVKDLTFD